MNINMFVKPTAIDPEQLIGTKWKGFTDTFADRIFMEFLDKSNCVYTSRPNKYPLTYNVNKGKLYINHINGAFELRGNVLFINDYPVFEKAA
ncbi:MAG: hypothetical protein FWB86_07795 [Treponema sp.]|nr:hypothetical protein [Treponema sp.]MCL2251681.1 hypothetical protein [Treponema sp.]